MHLICSDKNKNKKRTQKNTNTKSLQKLPYQTLHVVGAWAAGLLMGNANNKMIVNATIMTIDQFCKTTDYISLTAVFLCSSMFCQQTADSKADNNIVTSICLRIILIHDLLHVNY